VRLLLDAHRIAGPCCGALLADLGATVIKVEPPTGDSMRYVQRQPQDADGNSQQVCTGRTIISACAFQPRYQRHSPAK
jgi:crotonobetainyl-CoA:carnitine CoA-transferase CaiB-like acyl-CoA transferase